MKLQLYMSDNYRKSHKNVVLCGDPQKERKQVADVQSNELYIPSSFWHVTQLQLVHNHCINISHHMTAIDVVELFGWFSFITNGMILMIIELHNKVKYM